MRTGPKGFEGVAPKRHFATTPFSLPENEGNAPFMTNYYKNCLNIPCNSNTKNQIYESTTSFYASNALFVPEGTSDSKAEKI